MNIRNILGKNKYKQGAIRGSQVSARQKQAFAFVKSTVEGDCKIGWR